MFWGKSRAPGRPGHGSVYSSPAANIHTPAQPPIFSVLLTAVMNISKIFFYSFSLCIVRDEMIYCRLSVLSAKEGLNEGEFIEQALIS
jgi:hypothetical protein